MTQQDILHTVDHTILKPEATWDDAKRICDEALWGNTASVCLSPCFVPKAAHYLQGRLPLCTVIGFPHGTSATEVKAWESEHALRYGAHEIDMVIGLGLVRDARWEALLAEVRTVKAACGDAILKVIVEACLWTDAEKIRLCELVSAAGADFIKTSTGFSAGGATLADVRLFRSHIAPHVKIKAAGGIRTFADATAFLEAGADRLGSSALVALAKADA